MALIRELLSDRRAVFGLLCIVLSCVLAYVATLYIQEKALATLLQIACYLVTLSMLQKIGALVMEIKNRNES